MDDRELEARLRTQLHRRLDNAMPSSELLSAVRQVIATPPRRFGLPAVRGGSLRLGWPAVAAVLVVTILAGAGLRFGGLLGPGTPAITSLPSASAAPATERQFMVLPSSPTAPSKAETDLATTILTARLATFGFDSIISGGGIGILFTLPTTGPNDTQIYHALSATGDVAFVPLPPEDYGDGKLAAEVGAALPKDEPALFGWDGIASVTVEEDQQQRRVLNITLKPAATDAFGTYTAGSIGETFAVLIDGRVALLPVVNEAITGGAIQISGGSTSEDFEETMAILVGGMLPERWADPKVPEITPRFEIVERLLFESPGATVRSAELDVIRREDRWQAVWRVELDGEFRECIPGPSGDPSCLTATRMESVLDAETGDLISSRSFDD